MMPAAALVAPLVVIGDALLRWLLGSLALLLLSPYLLWTIASKGAQHLTVPKLVTVSQKLPFLGHYFLRYIIALKAPYSSSVCPDVRKVKVSEDGTNVEVEVRMANRTFLRNAFGSIHATALATLGEFVAGLCTVTVSEQLRRVNGFRAVPVGLNCQYYRRATGPVVACLHFSVSQVLSHLLSHPHEVFRETLPVSIFLDSEGKQFSRETVVAVIGVTFTFDIVYSGGGRRGSLKSRGAKSRRSACSSKTVSALYPRIPQNMLPPIGIPSSVAFPSVHGAPVLPASVGGSGELRQRLLSAHNGPPSPAFPRMMMSAEGSRTTSMSNADYFPRGGEVFVHRQAGGGGVDTMFEGRGKPDYIRSQDLMKSPETVAR